MQYARAGTQSPAVGRTAPCRTLRGEHLGGQFGLRGHASFADDGTQRLLQV